jgi:hypothetical protein
MAPPTDTQAAGLAALAGQLAGQAAQTLSDLPNRLHPGWVESMGADPAVLHAGGAGVLNAALLARFDLRWPDLSAAGHGLELAWLLAPDQLVRLCAARALFAWRGALARCVDAGVRRRVRALVGTETFDAIVGMAQGRREAAAAPLEAEVALPLGWSLLRRALPWRDVRSRRLVELMLPPVPAHIVAALGERADESAEHDGFASTLLDLFPEHSWLFGLEPASLTSA